MTGRRHPSGNAPLSSRARFMLNRLAREDAFTPIYTSWRGGQWQTMRFHLDSGLLELQRAAMVTTVETKDETLRQWTLSPLGWRAYRGEVQ